ncbi:transcriptional regulator, partial [Clostridium sp. 2-1]
MIPRFILQPLIENAVEHGMNYENGQYFISVTVAATDENIRISVEDTG